MDKTRFGYITLTPEETEALYQAQEALLHGQSDRARERINSIINTLENQDRVSYEEG